MNSPGLTVRRDLTEDHLRRLLEVIDREPSRPWALLTEWATGQMRMKSVYAYDGDQSFGLNPDDLDEMIIVIEEDRYW